MMALNAECCLLSVIYAECLKQAHYAECHYAECCYVECRGAPTLPRQSVCPVDSDNVLGSLALSWNSNRKKQVPKKINWLS
jgi:hypothetical protein